MRRLSDEPRAPDGFFRLTHPRPASDTTAAYVRARWRASLAVLGIRTVEIVEDGLVALWREGEEAISTSGGRMRARKNTAKTTAGTGVRT